MGGSTLKRIFAPCLFFRCRTGGWREARLTKISGRETRRKRIEKPTHHWYTALRPVRAFYPSVGSARLCERNPTYTSPHQSKWSNRPSPPKRMRGDNQKFTGGHGRFDADVNFRATTGHRTGGEVGRPTTALFSGLHRFSTALLICFLLFSRGAGAGAKPG
jgi:hypothetical protein